MRLIGGDPTAVQGNTTLECLAAYNFVECSTILAASADQTNRTDL